MKNKNFFISVSNGILDDSHFKRMGTSIWQFLWCLDKVTKINEDEVGIVLGGKPIQLKDVIGGHRVSVSRNLAHLEKEGYIKLIHTAYGIIIHVMKMKKRFNKNVKPRINNFVKPTLTKTLNPRNKNVKPVYKNVKPNKTYTDDNTVDNTVRQGAEIEQVRLIRDLIESFSKINPACKKMYGHPVQRDACVSLIKEYGFARVQFVIEKTLPKTNAQAFFPTIVTPQQLFQKWVPLESAILKYKSKIDIKNNNGRGIAE